MIYPARDLRGRTIGLGTDGELGPWHATYRPVQEEALSNILEAERQAARNRKRAQREKGVKRRPSRTRKTASELQQAVREGRVRRAAIT